MTVTTNTLGSNTAEIVITGPGESFLNVNTAINSFLTTHGWTLVPDTAITNTVTGTSGSTITTGTTGLVVGMPVRFGTAIGGLATGTTYYVLTIGSGVITVSTLNYVQNSSATAVTGLSVTSGQSVTMTSQVNGAVALTGNSTNYAQRAYYAPNLTGADYKYIIVNLMDYTIDTGTAVSVTVSSGRNFYSFSTGSYRFNHYNNVSFPRDSYFYSNSTPTVGIQIPLSPTFDFTANSGAYSSGNFGTINLPTASQGYCFYPGQTLVAYNPQYNAYALATVSAYTDSSAPPLLSMNAPVWSSLNSSAGSGWYLMNYGLNYNQSSSPAYIYINATARHVCIQARNTDGTWFDWTAVTELENPLGLSNNWGLTTGYMSSNSGYTMNVNSGYGFSGYTGSAPVNGGGTVASIEHTLSSASSWSLLRNSALVRSPPVTSSNLNGKYTIFTGPFAVPSTNGYSAAGVTSTKVGSFAAQTSKLVTPIGEAGYIGTVRKQNFEGMGGTGGTTTTIVVNEMTSVYYKGLGDIIPTQTSVVAGAKHWAVSCSLITDITTASNVTTFLMDTRIDNIESQNLWNSNIVQGNKQSYKDMSQYRAPQPTTMGRLYGLKAVSSNLPPTTTISIKVDASGFTSTAGSATDHFVFSTPSYYISPTQYAISSINLPTNVNGIGSQWSHTITNTYANGNITTTTTFTATLPLIAGTPVVFYGVVAGGIVAGQTYYVSSTFVSGTTFTVSTIPGGSISTWIGIAGQSFTAIFGWPQRETINEQTQIRSSQQASVAFPK